MFKGFINKYLKAAINDLFSDAHAKDSFSMSLGMDLFSDSTVNLKNLTFRPDLFDAYLHPFKLVSGHLGALSIEGFAEFAIHGGNVKINAENIFLLFSIDTEIDPEYVQYLKKTLVELQSSSVSHNLFREVLKRLQGFPSGKDPDFKKQRLLMLKMMGYLFRNLQATIKSVHVRIETPSGTFGTGNPLYCSALGFTLPLARLAPNSTVRPDGISKEDPTLSLLLKTLQVYCDYDCETYTSNGATSASILKQFQSRWKHEVHTASLLPFDLELAVAAEIRKRTGLVAPKLIVNIPKLRATLDVRQLEVLRQLYEQFVLARKRCQHLVTLRATFGREGPPRVVVVGGSHVLPTLAPGVLKVPPPAQGESRLVMLLKARVGMRWKKALWKHLIRVVIHDVRMARPLGRWLEIARLAVIRKDYTLTYSRLLKRSPRSGNFIFNVNARVDMLTVKKLFDWEMFLSVKAVTMFRGLAVMVAIVESFNAKRFQSRQSNSRSVSSLQPYERISITWRDILTLQAELVDAQDSSAFRRRVKDVSNDEDDDETASVYSMAKSRLSVGDDRQSMFGYKPQSGVSSAGIMSGVSGAASVLNSTATNAVKYMPTMSLPVFSSSSSTAGSVYGGSSHGSGANVSPAKQPTSIQPFHSPSGSLSSVAQVSRALMGASQMTQFDETDSKLFGRKEMNAFGDFLGTLELEEKHSELESSQQPSVQLVHKVFDWGLEGDSPSISAVSEAVEFAILRNEKPLTLLPPDLTLRVGETELILRRPLDSRTRSRATLGAALATGFSASISITDSLGDSTATPVLAPPSSYKTRSSLNGNLGNKLNSELMGGKKSGWASIAGSLIQLRCTLQSASLQVHVHDKALLTAFSGPVVNGVITLASLAGKPQGVSALSAATAKVKDEAASKVIINEEIYDDDNDNGREELSENIDDSDVNGDYTLPGYEAESLPVTANITLDTAAVATARVNAINKPQEPIALQISKTIEKDSEPLVVTVLKTREGEQSLTLCVMLDLDDTGEGGADVQIHTGHVRVDLGGELLAFALDDSIKSYMRRMRELQDDLKYLGRVRQEPALYIDPITKLPYVETFLHDILPTRKQPVLGASANPIQSATGQTQAAATSFSTDAQDKRTDSHTNDEDDDESDDDENGDDENIIDDTRSMAVGLSSPLPQPDGVIQPVPIAVLQSAEEALDGNVDSEVRKRLRQAAKAKRLVRREHLNFQHWRCILRGFVPSAFSMCARIAPITVDSLTHLTVERLVYAETQKVSDRACEIESRRQNAQTSQQQTYLGLNFARRSYAGLLVHALTELRLDSLKGRNLNHSPLPNFGPAIDNERDARLHVDLPSIDLVLVKRSKPSPELLLKACGIEIRVPVAQDAIFDLAALGLKRNIPHYK